MTAAPLVAESEAFRAIATLDGRTRCNVFMYRKTDLKTPMLSADINVNNHKERAEALAASQIEEWYHDEADDLLRQLAAIVSAERVRPKPIPESTAGFEEIEQWADPVDGAELLAEIVEVFQRFLVFPEGGVEAVALWTLHAWSIDAFQISPILAVTSAERSSGKSQSLDVLQMLVHRPMRDSNPSDAVVFRTIHKYRPTVMLDEADNIDWRKRSELLGMLNNGYRRAGAFSWRCEGEDFEPTAFSVWAPKALVGLKALPDTTASRSIVIRMERKPKDRKLQRLRWDRVHESLRPIRQRALRWATDHIGDLRDADPATPAGFTDRQADNWIPLLAVADLVGGDWPRRAREAAKTLRGGRDSADLGSPGEMLLADIRDIFTRAGDPARMPTREILDALIDREDRPWAEYRGKPLSGQGLAALLRRFDIHPERETQRDGPRTFKGYARSSFVKAWQVWVPNEPGDDSCDGLEGEPSHTQLPYAGALAASRDDVTDKVGGDGQGALEVGDAWEPAA